MEKPPEPTDGFKGLVRWAMTPPQSVAVYFVILVLVLGVVLAPHPRLPRFFLFFLGGCGGVLSARARWARKSRGDWPPRQCPPRATRLPRGLATTCFPRGGHDLRVLTKGLNSGHGPS